MNKHDFWPLTMLTAFFALAASAETPQRDPFRAPSSVAAGNAAASANDSSRSNAIEIRGILMSGGQALVNFGGTIMRTGEEVNGYKLLEISENHAIFQYGENVITLSLYPDNDDETDAP